jgi:regulator of sigma E protease
VKLSGKPVSTWKEVELDLGLAPRENIPVELLRNGQTVSLTLRPEPKTKYDIGYTGLNPNLPPVIGQLVAGYPGQKAGLLPDDRIVSVGGNEVSGYYEIVRRVRGASASFPSTGPQPIDFVIERGGRRFTIPVTPREEAGSWRIGFSPKYELVHRRLGLGAALAASWKETSARPR